MVLCRGARALSQPGVQSHVPWVIPVTWHIPAPVKHHAQESSFLDDEQGVAPKEQTLVHTSAISLPIPIPSPSGV